MTNKYLIFLVSFILLLSCSTHKQFVYFQGDTSTPDSPSNYNPTFKSDDFILVIVTAEDTESAMPFNFPIRLTQQGGGVGGYTQGIPQRAGYLIDPEGNVELPIIGKIHAAGKDRMSLISELQNIYSEYLKKPVVNIQIENFKITLLGEVNNPGTYQIPNERITLLEAIGLAGDLKITGERKNVLVIRDRNGQKSEFRIDLTTRELFSSEVYYLEQNDVVYVEPNAAARTQGTLWRSAGPLFISLTSLVITTVVLIAR
jgi:polysaccharide biosynthesis/export protein